MKKLAQTMTGCAAALLLLFGGTAMAALSQAQQRFQEERAACLSGASNEDRATCLREAGAALQEARRGGLAGDEREYGRNRTARCAALPQPEREDCTMRMNGQGSTSGSARQGGILRELERPVPARPIKRRNAEDPMTRSAAAAAPKRVRCTGCGVVEDIEPLEIVANQPAQFQFTVRMRDRSIRVSRSVGRASWNVGDRIMLMGGAGASRE